MAKAFECDGCKQLKSEALRFKIGKKQIRLTEVSGPIITVVAKFEDKSGRALDICKTCGLEIMARMLNLKPIKGEDTDDKPEAE